MVHGAQSLRELALRVLHPVALVHDDVLPLCLPQGGLVLQGQAGVSHGRSTWSSKGR